MTVAIVDEAKPVRSRRSHERYVLCIDDDRDFLKSLEFFLPGTINQPGADGLWYRFLFLDDPREALKVLEEIVSEGEQVALLISDQMMPGMKGTAFLAEARTVSIASTRALLTGHAGIESAIAAINAGLLDRYLTKPISNEEDFALNVRHLLEQYETRIELQDRNGLIERLYDFSNHLNAKDTLEDTGATLLTFARETFNCQRVDVVLADEREHSPHASDDGLATFRPAVACAVIDGSAPARPPTVGRVEQIAGIQGLAPGPLAHAPGPFVFGMLRDGNSVHGVIVASGPAAAALDDADLRNLGYLCDTAAIAIGNQLRRRRLVLAWDKARIQAAQLAAANGRLVILDKLRGDFLTFISHELRTPLSYFAAVNLLDIAKTPEEVGELTGIVRRGYERLERFVTKGLDYFGWLGTERLVAATTTDLAAMTREAIAKRVEQVGDTRFDLVGATEECWAAIEMHHAEEILDILLSNAVKFSASDQRITIHVGSVSGCPRIVVTDAGRGFPEEWTDEICRPFTIVETGHHREGTALSLATAFEIVRSYGGTLTAHSKGLGKGATFTVALPSVTAQHGGGSAHADGDEADGPTDASSIAA